MKKELLTGILLILVIGCTRDNTDSRSMEEIYRQEGVPVRTQLIEPQTFSQSLFFNGRLSGIRESSAYASIGDRVEKIMVKVGDLVTKDQVLLTFPEDNPSASFLQARAAYENASASFTRISRLYETGGISRQQLDDAQAGVEVAKANWDAVRQLIRVQAPIAGTITRVNIQETDNVEREQELFAISDLSRMKVRIQVTDKEISRIQTGRKAFARWNGQVLEGRVTQVDLSQNPRQQSFGVVAVFDNPNEAIPAGATAEIEIEVYSSSGSIVIGIQHMQRSLEGDHVYVLQDGKAVLQPVTLGNRQNNLIEIADGLQIGQELITEGLNLITPNVKVKVVD